MVMKYCNTKILKIGLVLHVTAFLCALIVLLNFIQRIISINELKLLALVIPTFILFSVKIIEKSKFINNSKLQRTLYFDGMKIGAFISIFLYLLILLFEFVIWNYKAIILILILGFVLETISLILLNLGEFKNKQGTEYNTPKIKQNLFNTYFINISKVFEIAMLINNKIMKGIENEKTSENKNESLEKTSLNINVDYLNSVKSGMNYDTSFVQSNSEKNRVLENFDVKTTKSNLLDVIIKKCKEYSPGCTLCQGDLFVFKNVQIELMNQEETMQIMKLLLNGALNGTVISGESEGFNMQLNMSSLINSFLKDCSYNLKCNIDDFSFLIKIPMSFENDFENSYNVYDLLIGKMTLIGTYRGKDYSQKYKSFSEIVLGTSTTSPPEKKQEDKPKTKSYNLLKQSSITELGNPIHHVEMDSVSTVDHTCGSDFDDYVDVIAIIQEIDFE